MSTIVEDIRRAVREERIPQRFRAGDVRRACPGWARNTYGSFLPSYRLGNPGGMSGTSNATATARTPSSNRGELDRRRSVLVNGVDGLSQWLVEQCGFEGVGVQGSGEV